MGAPPANLTGPPARDGRYRVGAAIIAFGAAFAAFVFIDLAVPLSAYSGWDFSYSVILPAVFKGVLPGTAFVVVGVRAIRHRTTLAEAIGAAAGALSGPLSYHILAFGHENDSGMDFGRGFVGIFMLLLLPVNMRIGARVGARVAEWGAVHRRGDSPETMSHGVARAVGLGVIVTAGLILWQAHLELSPDPRIALWEFVHHGILPAAPIALVGVLTAALPSRLPLMWGALLGVVPALLCSSLLVDPDPANHGQTPAALVAYSLPITLPITVGLGVLWADRIDRRRRGLVG